MEQNSQQSALSYPDRPIGLNQGISHAPDFSSEVDEIRQRYEIRQGLIQTAWNPLLPYNLMFCREKWAALAKWINQARLQPLQGKRLLEIGCGLGEDLLFLVSLGFSPENIVANELLKDRAIQLEKRLPAASRLLVGDATQIDLGEEQFDIVYQSLVFSSLLDDGLQRTVADRMWSLAKPGGGVLWYDFIYNNKKNPHVRGIPVRAIRDLFPEGRLQLWTLTLAPPIGRFVTKIWPGLYTLFGMIPLLRTHVLCWIQKP